MNRLVATALCAAACSGSNGSSGIRDAGVAGSAGAGATGGGGSHAGGAAGLAGVPGIGGAAGMAGSAGNGGPGGFDAGASAAGEAGSAGTADSGTAGAAGNDASIAGAAGADAATAGAGGSSGTAGAAASDAGGEPDAPPPCGDLGQPCCAGDTCVQGAYQCDATSSQCVCKDECNGSCRDLDTDRYNCGSCGHTCGISCAAGACTTVVSMAAGEGHSCALLSDHSVWCWGWNLRGQLGDGTNTGHLTPILVPGAAGAVGIVAGREHTCAWYADGSAKCWGGNQYGQLGDGTTTDRNAPAPVLADATDAFHGATSVVAGAYTTCAVTAGAPACWGRNDAGQIPMPLGSGNGPVLYPYTDAPAFFSEPTAFVAVGASHLCAATSSFIKCWGSNVYGQTTPGVPSGIVKGLVAGDDFGCWWGTDTTNVASSRTACWGNNQDYQLGDGTTNNATTGAVDATGVPGVLELVGATAGARFACAWEQLDGGCWGANDHGQLADATTNSAWKIDRVNGVERIAAGVDHACGWQVANEGASCWGANTHGQVGDATITERHWPVQVKW